MSIKTEKLGGFGDLIRITNDTINIDVSTAFGPYILNASFCGGEKFFTLRAIEGTLKEFKLGVSNRENYSAFLINDEMFVKRFEYIEGANYPDNGTNFETYTYDGFLECESLGRLQKLEYNETATYKENWELYKNIKTPAFNDDKEIKKIIKIIKE